MRLLPTTFSGILLIALMSTVSAQFKEAGTVNYQHLLLSYDARTAALGGAGSALPGGVGMVMVNPAVLATNSKRSGFIGYSNLGLGIWGTALSYSQMYSFGTLAFSMQGLTSGDVEVIEVFNKNPVLTDRIATDQYLTPSVSYARSFLQERVLVGASLKGMYQRIDDSREVFSSKAVGVDVGVQYRDYGDRFIAAAVMRNVGAEVQSFNDDDSYGTPMVFEAAVSYVPRYIPNLRVVADVNKTRGAYIMYEPGIEMEVYPGAFLIRAGFPFSQRDLEEFIGSFSSEQVDDDKTYVRSTLNTFACGVGIKTKVSQKSVAIDVSLQLKDDFFPPTVVLSSIVEF